MNNGIAAVYRDILNRKTANNNQHVIRITTILFLSSVLGLILMLMPLPPMTVNDSAYQSIINRWKVQYSFSQICVHNKPPLMTIHLCLLIHITVCLSHKRRTFPYTHAQRHLPDTLNKWFTNQSYVVFIFLSKNNTPITCFSRVHITDESIALMLTVCQNILIQVHVISCTKFPKK